jgi:hypothetical protein
MTRSFERCGGCTSRKVLRVEKIKVQRQTRMSNLCGFSVLAFVVEFVQGWDVSADVCVFDEDIMRSDLVELLEGHNLDGFTKVSAISVRATWTACLPDNFLSSIDNYCCIICIRCLFPASPILSFFCSSRFLDSFYCDLYYRSSGTRMFTCAIVRGRPVFTLRTHALIRFIRRVSLKRASLAQLGPLSLPKAGL